MPCFSARRGVVHIITPRNREESLRLVPYNTTSHLAVLPFKHVYKVYKRKTRVVLRVAGPLFYAPDPHVKIYIYNNAAACCSVPLSTEQATIKKKKILSAYSRYFRKRS